MADERMFIAKQDFFHCRAVMVYPLTTITGLDTIAAMNCRVYHSLFLILMM